MDSPFNSREKQKKLLATELCKIKSLYKKHYKNFRKYKRLSTISKVIINLCNSITVSSVVLSFSGTFPILIVTIVSSSLSSGVSVISDSFDWIGKMHSSQTSYLQLLDLYNSYNIQSTHRNADYTKLLEQINSRLGLILDNSIPVSESLSRN